MLWHLKRKHMLPRRKQQELQKEIAKFALEKDDASDIDLAVNNFMFVSEQRGLFQPS